MFLDIFDIKKYSEYSKLYEATRGKNFSAAFGVQSAEKIFLSANLDRFVLFVTADSVQAQETVRQINAYAKKSFEFFPSRQEVLLYKAEGIKSRMERSVALFKIFKGESGGIVTTPDALGQMLPCFEAFAQSVFTLCVGDVIKRDEFLQKLLKNGFERVEQIEAAGQFTARGDIVDVFLPQYESPVRFDFFDDEIESIKSVNKETFVSEKKLISVEIFAIKEIFDQQEALENCLTEAKTQQLNPDANARLQAILSMLAVSPDNPWLYPFAKKSLMADFLPEDTLVVWDEPRLIQEKLERIYRGFDERFAGLLFKGEVLPSHFGNFFERAELFRKYDKFAQLALQTLPSGGTFFVPKKIINFKSSAILNYKFDIRQLAADVKNWDINGYSVFVFASDRKQADALSAQMSDFGLLIELGEEPLKTRNKPVILLRPVAKGFVSHSNKLVLVGTNDLFFKSEQKKLKPRREKVFLNLAAGDYAVHSTHGIGLCEGVVSKTGAFGTKDYIKLLYRDGDAVFVPVENTDMLSRYSGSDVAPRLSRLGGAEFEKVKAKVKQQIKTMAIDLVKLYAERKHARGFRYKIDKYLDEEFDAGFGFKETPDQLKCEEEINADFTSDKIMDRLLVGDVGFGKTEVALRAAFKVVSNGKQVAFLAPTTILTEQHFSTVRERCKQFGIRVACLNRFYDRKAQTEILKKVQNGEIDILVGTHRLLGKDVKFKDLGFLILDEEQRFGVEDKEKIKVLKTNVDVLSMSATPIPRTLYMALSGMKDISVISTPPKVRIAVETFVVQQSDALIRDVILREKDRQGQTFLVFNSVMGIEYFVERIRHIVPEVSITYAHGQMDEKILENNVLAFYRGEYDVLVCTTIIENGIDMPNANTIMVFDADKLGLGQLYQLRGRVGRSDKAAYAYFVYREDKLLTENALKRLSGILEYSDLGSGFKIAMKDLEIRGAGNVLGREQHGHLVKVGYDMYVKLLNEAMDEINGKKADASFETTMEISVSAYVPSDYVPTKERMTLYQRIAEIETEEQSRQLISELTDIYGVPPIQTQELIKIALLKSMANKAGICEVEIGPTSARLCFVDKEKLQQRSTFDAMNLFADKCKFDLTRKLAVVFDFSDGTVAENILKIRKFVSFLTQNAC